MHLSVLFSSILLFAVAAVQAHSGMVKVHVVQVGLKSTLTFSPESIQADPGDMVQFQFHQKNHSVVQSAFNSPCAPINTVMSNVTGFRSGFMPVAANATSIPVFTMAVRDTKPIWAYCSQVGHCGRGMVFAVNAPANGSKTFAAFKALAMSSTSSNSSSPSSSGTSSSGSGSDSSPAAGNSAGSATSSTPATPLSTSAGAGLFVDTALLLLLSLAGFAFVAL